MVVIQLSITEIGAIETNILSPLIRNKRGGFQSGESLTEIP